MKKTLLSIFVLVILLFSCQKKRTHVNEFYPNGNIQREYDTIGEGIKNGIFRSYYESGKKRKLASTLRGMR